MLRVWDSWRGLSCCQAATGVVLVKVAGLLLEDLLRPVAADLLVLSMREGPGPFPDPQPRTPKTSSLWGHNNYALYNRMSARHSSRPEDSDLFEPFQDPETHEVSKLKLQRLKP